MSKVQMKNGRKTAKKLMSMDVGNPGGKAVFVFVHNRLCHIRPHMNADKTNKKLMFHVSRIMSDKHLHGTDKDG